MLLTLLAIAIPASANVPAYRKPLSQPKIVDAKLVAKTGGRWYMSAEGHAVFCYGPTMLIRGTDGNFEKVATFCRDGRPIVPLHE
jgi:hypothetical protein